MEWNDLYWMIAACYVLTGIYAAIEAEKPVDHQERLEQKLREARLVLKDSPEDLAHLQRLEAQFRAANEELAAAEQKLDRKHQLIVKVGEFIFMMVMWFPIDCFRWYRKMTKRSV